MDWNDYGFFSIHCSLKCDEENDGKFFYVVFADAGRDLIQTLVEVVGLFTPNVLSRFGSFHFPL